MALIGVMTPKWPIFFCQSYDQIWLPYIMMASNCVLSYTWLPTLCPDYHHHVCIRYMIKIIWTHDGQCLFWPNMSNSWSMNYFEVFCILSQTQPNSLMGSAGHVCEVDVGDVIPSEVCCNITLFYVIKLVIVMICRTLSWPAQLLWIKLRRTWNLFYVLQEGGHVFHQIIVSLHKQPQGHRGQTWVTDMSGSLSSSVCMSGLLGDACMNVDISIHPLPPSPPHTHPFILSPWTTEH